ncbi:MAG TPA: VOC family protein [Candidatus Acidoferrales bacterium]|nr:VOC family protein [Candidatus Acidoferrales bacterium]
MSAKAKPIPEGFHSITPYLTVSDAARSIDFYKRAFGASERYRMEGPGGKIVHAEIKIGDSIVMLGDESIAAGNRSPQSLGGTTNGLFIYVEDVDSAFNRAAAAGAKVDMPVADMFWGDRYGKLTDPFGQSWSLATHIEDVAPEEMARRGKEAMAKMGGQQARKQVG